MQKNFSLRSLNTFGIEVEAAEYGSFDSSASLRECLSHSNYTPWILGGGSNVLLTDNLPFSVLQNDITGIQAIMQDNIVIVTSGAGVVWHDLVTWCVGHGYGGIENLALIPGKVGAAPIQNIGAYGVELKDVFVDLTAVRLNDGQEETFSHTDCAFGYRDSVFKQSLKDQYCITSLRLRLTAEAHQVNTSYGAIADTLSKKGITEPGIADVYQAVIAIRQSKLPDPALIGNAGSFFKNPTVEESLFHLIKAEYPLIPSYEAGPGLVKIPAGWLIEQCGWRGRRIGNVGCYEKQALVIVNYGGATGREIFDHAMRVQESVQSKFGIRLHPEVNIIGQEITSRR